MSPGRDLHDLALVVQTAGEHHADLLGGIRLNAQFLQRNHAKHCPAALRLSDQALADRIPLAVVFPAS